MCVCKIESMCVYKRNMYCVCVCVSGVWMTERVCVCKRKRECVRVCVFMSQTWRERERAVEADVNELNISNGFFLLQRP